MVLKRAGWFAAASCLVLAFVVSACGGDDPASGCASDGECKGDRVCLAGVCQQADDPNNDLPDAVDVPDPGEPDVPTPEDVPVVEDVPAPEDVPTPEDVPSEEELPDFEPPDVEGDVAEEDVEEEVGEAIGPVIAVSPEAIDFGEVGVLVSTFDSVAITNEGDRPLTLSGFDLRVSPSQGFQLISERPAPVVLAPEESIDLRIRFQPPVLRGDRPTPYGNTLEIRSDDPERPLALVPLEGLAVPDPPQCLAFDQRAVDFGFIPPDEVTVEQLTLTNCGTEALDVTALNLIGETPEVAVTIGSELPVSLEPEGTFSVILTYTPTEVAVVRGSLIAETNLDIEAEVILSAAPECPVAVATGSIGDGEPVADRVRAILGQPITLSAAQSEDPGRGDLAYTWAIEAPEGSEDLQVVPNDLDNESFEVVPDVIGVYRVTLSVRSDITELDACEVAELLLDVGPAVPAAQIVLTWNNGADLDLHTVRSEGEGFGDFGTGQQRPLNDCFFGNFSPDWGQQGVGFDNPRLLGDDTDGEGPETTLVPVLEADRRYRVAINYARRLNTERVEATVTITLAGQDEPQVFTGTLEDRGVFWVPAVIEGDGSLTEVDEFIEQ